MADSRSRSGTSPHHGALSLWRPVRHRLPAENHDSRAAQAPVRAVDRRPQILGYLHLRPRTPKYSQAVLEGAIERFAERHSYRLAKIFVESSGGSDLSALSGLIEQILCGQARTVVIVGTTPTAFTALRPFAGVQVLTLDDNPGRREH